jgi:acyl carrier protein
MEKGLEWFKMNLKKSCLVSPDKIDQMEVTDKLGDDLGMDSLDVLETSADLEKHLNCIIQDEETESWKTVGDIMTTYETKTNQQRDNQTNKKTRVMAEVKFSEVTITIDGYDLDRIGNVEVLYKVIPSANEPERVAVCPIPLSDLGNKLSELFFKKENAEMEAFKQNKLRMAKPVLELKRDIASEIDVAKQYIAECYRNMIVPQVVIWAMEYAKKFPGKDNRDLLKMAYDDWTINGANEQ